MPPQSPFPAVVVPRILAHGLRPPDSICLGLAIRSQEQACNMEEPADFRASRTSGITDAGADAVICCKHALPRRADDDLFEQQLRRLEDGGMFST
jgi:hypothetical protein